MARPTKAEREIAEKVAKKLEGRSAAVTYTELNQAYEAARKALGTAPEKMVVSQNTLQHIMSMFQIQQRFAGTTRDGVIGLAFRGSVILASDDAYDGEIGWIGPK